jgi:homocitrate synthase NifV
LEDTTLRDGEQSPGIAFGKEAKMAIYRKLVEIGVKWIEIGIPAMKGNEAIVLQEINEMSYSDKVNVIAWNRGILDDIAYSISLGFKIIHIGLPTSDIHLRDSIKKNRKWLLNRATELIKFAKDKEVFVSISAEDIGRTEISFLEEYAYAIAEAGADRLRLSDTIGILTPEQYAYIVTRIKKITKIDLQCHAHNDFGLAVINTIYALLAGARYFHVTVNAIGERSGMPDFAQVVIALKRLYNIDLGINTAKLAELSELVAKYTNINLYPWHPIVGSNVFAHESGIHANAIINNSKTFEPFPPELVGGERKIIIGKHSGKAAIQYKLKDLGIEEVQEGLLDCCLTKVREKAVLKQSSLSESELIDIYNQLK